MGKFNDQTFDVVGRVRARPPPPPLINLLPPRLRTTALDAMHVLQTTANRYFVMSFFSHQWLVVWKYSKAFLYATHFAFLQSRADASCYRCYPLRMQCTCSLMIFTPDRQHQQWLFVSWKNWTRCRFSAWCGSHDQRRIGKNTWRRGRRRKRDPFTKVGSRPECCVWDGKPERGNGYNLFTRAAATVLLLIWLLQGMELFYTHV